LALVLAGVSAVVVVRGGYHAFDVEIALNRSPDRWRPAFDALYTKPWMRAGGLLSGVAAAIVHRSRGALAALASRRVASACGFAVALVVAGAATHWPLAVGLPRPLEVAYMATYRLAFAASIAYVLLFSICPHPLGRAVGRVLAWRGFYPFGQLSFAAYLVNPIVTTLVHSTLAGWVRRTGTPPLAAFLPADVAATFVVATVLHLTIERPALRMRPRLVAEATTAP
jgi:peptidoglycan/LPS O-acetylase OafA/YrhL